MMRLYGCLRQMVGITNASKYACQPADRRSAVAGSPVADKTRERERDVCAGKERRHLPKGGTLTSLVLWNVSADSLRIAHFLLKNIDRIPSSFIETGPSRIHAPPAPPRELLLLDECALLLLAPGWPVLGDAGWLPMDKPLKDLARVEPNPEAREEDEDEARPVELLPEVVL